jgi:hypothetical protein
LTWVRLLLMALVVLGPAGRSSAQPPESETSEDFGFDVGPFEKKPYEWGGFFELKGTQQILDPDAHLLGRSEPPEGWDRLAHQATGALDLTATLRKGPVTAHGHLRGTAGTGQLGFSHQLRAFRLSIAAQLTELLSFEVGKSPVRWGKGYAFNPTAFIDRPKDPGDPEEALEGFILARADFTKSFPGSLRTLDLSLAMLPVHEGVNEDFGRLGHENFAARLYLLLFDADIDLVALSAGSRSARYGLAVAYNIVPNLEVHAEAAHVPHAEVPRLTSGEAPRTEERQAVQALAGARFLSPRETTYILEYFCDSAGASPEQLGLFYDQQDVPSTPDGAGDPSALHALRTPFPMRHYLYLRISQKEPFGVLDFFPSVTGIVNLEDASFSVTPELLYKGITNLELRLRGTAIVGRADTDFGERPNDARIELRARYFF